MTSMQIYGVLLTPMQICPKIEIIEGYAEFEDFSNTWCGIMNLPPRPRHFLARLPRWKLNKARLNGIAFEYPPSELFLLVFSHHQFILIYIVCSSALLLLCTSYAGGSKIKTSTLLLKVN